MLSTAATNLRTSSRLFIQPASPGWDEMSRTRLLRRSSLLSSSRFGRLSGASAASPGPSVAAGADAAGSLSAAGAGRGPPGDEEIDADGRGDDQDDADADPDDLFRIVHGSLRCLSRTVR